MYKGETVSGSVPGGGVGAVSGQDEHAEGFGCLEALLNLKGTRKTVQGKRHSFRTPGSPRGCFQTSE